MRRGQQWFRNMLQCMILITGFYILYRGGGILAESGWIGRLLHSEQTAQAMKEFAVSAYLPDYEAALDAQSDSVIGAWLRELAPLLWEEYWKQQEERETLPEEITEEITEGRKRTVTEDSDEAVPESQMEIDTAAVTERETETEYTPQTEAVRQTELEDATRTETEETAPTEPESQIQEASVIPMENLADFDYLLNHYFAVDPDTTADASQLDALSFLETDLTIEKNPDVPQILIYHTHSQETFLDSVEGDVNTSIIGIGDYLTQLLEERYGYQVIHDTGVYDLVDGVLDRSAAYDYARESIQKILEEYPTIEVVIDLHRDGVEGIHFVTDVNGKDTAQIMFLNGLSKDSQGQEVTYLPNPYIQENLAFSFQLQLAAQQSYPGFTRNIYLKGQRYNLHLRPRSLLIEAGSQLNTVEEEKNAMEPLADILNQVLSGEGS